MYSNCCCSCSFEFEILKIGQSSHKMYSNNIVNFQVSTTMPGKKSGNLSCAPRILKLAYFLLYLFFKNLYYCLLKRLSKSSLAVLVNELGHIR